jgi:hypothetical protein
MSKAFFTFLTLVLTISLGCSQKDNESSDSVESPRLGLPGQFKKVEGLIFQPQSFPQKFDERLNVNDQYGLEIVWMTKSKNKITRSDNWVVESRNMASYRVTRHSVNRIELSGQMSPYLEKTVTSSCTLNHGSSKADCTEFVASKSDLATPEISNLMESDEYCDWDYTDEDGKELEVSTGVFVTASGKTLPSSRLERRIEPVSVICKLNGTITYEGPGTAQVAFIKSLDLPDFRNGAEGRPAVVASHTFVLVGNRIVDEEQTQYLPK